MAKKQQSTEKILINAEKFFQRKNYQVALKEFQKAQKKLDNKDIAEKINICRNEIAFVKAKDFVKRGHKSIKKNDPAKALTCFKNAQKILKEEWLAEKIKDIEYILTGLDADINAKKAEKSDDFEKAAKLYLTSAKTSDDVSLFKKSASCMVKAKKYFDAVNLFKTIDIISEDTIYDYGFSLIKTGDFVEGLKVWSQLKTLDESFIKQKEKVLYLACSDIYDKLNENSDFALIFNNTDYILNEAIKFKYKDLIPILRKIYKYCKYSWIEKLWESEEYEIIAKLMENTNTRKSPTLLALNAKVYFHLANNDSKYLKSMTTFWLTAIYSDEIAAEFLINSPKEQVDHKQLVQKRLIELVESLLYKHRLTEHGKQAVIYLEIDKNLTDILLSLIKKEKGVENFICTPGYAATFGLSNEILKVIRKNNAYFKDKKDFLEAGGFYSQAWESLYLVKTNEVEKALTMLDNLSMSAKKSRFVKHVMRVVQFEYGKYSIINNRKDFLQYFDTAPELFKTAPEYEEEFIKKILEMEDEELEFYEKVLILIHKNNNTPVITKALSLVMTRFVHQKYQNRGIPQKGMKGALVKALKIDPDNELAITLLHELNIDHEYSVVADAVSKRKMGKAIDIVLKSEYPETEDNYFSVVDHLLDSLEESVDKFEYYDVILSELYEWSLMITKEHYVLDRMKYMMEEEE